MPDVSRRALMFGAGLGVTAAGGFMSSASAAEVNVSLDKPVYAPGELMTLTIVEDLTPGRHTSVTDSHGHEWSKVSDNGRTLVWQATAVALGAAVVTVTMRHRGRDTYTVAAGYTVGSTQPEQPTEPEVPTGLTIVGMSSPKHLWATRLAEVGATGVTARRIFADLASGANDQMDLVEEAHAAGMMPVVSYKVGGDAAGAAAGRFNAVAEEAAARLAAYGKPTTVTYWHEPHGDMTPQQFVAGNLQILPAFKQGQIKVGPLLNGWLLDRRQADFTSYCPDEAFALWDWFGIDTYEQGTIDNPGNIKPADRIPKLVDYIESRGLDHPLGVGEYNGYSAETIRAAGEAILSEPRMWLACMWNSTTGKGHTLTGERLAAFRATLADPRVRK